MIHCGRWQQATGSYALIVADPPYSLTQCKWDKAIDMSEVWCRFKDLLIENGVVVFTAAQPFTSSVVTSNLPWFRYALVWEKTKAVGHLNVKKRPLVAHEDVLVFSKGKLGSHTYNAQLTEGAPYKGRTRKIHKSTYGQHGSHRNNNTGFRHPRSVLKVAGVERGWHPTRKPPALMSWIVKTYSNPGDRVLEPYGGSCPVHASCAQIGDRHCDSYEIDQEYYEKARLTTEVESMR